MTVVEYQLRCTGCGRVLETQTGFCWDCLAPERAALSRMWQARGSAGILVRLPTYHQLLMLAVGLRRTGFALGQIEGWLAVAIRLRSPHLGLPVCGRKAGIIVLKVLEICAELRADEWELSLQEAC